MRPPSRVLIGGSKSPTQSRLSDFFASGAVVGESLSSSKHVVTEDADLKLVGFGATTCRIPTDATEHYDRFRFHALRVALRDGSVERSCSSLLITANEMWALLCSDAGVNANSSHMAADARRVRADKIAAIINKSTGTTFEERCVASAVTFLSRFLDSQKSSAKRSAAMAGFVANVLPSKVIALGSGNVSSEESLVSSTDVAVEANAGATHAEANIGAMHANVVDGASVAATVTSIDAPPSQVAPVQPGQAEPVQPDQPALVPPRPSPDAPELPAQEVVGVSEPIVALPAWAKVGEFVLVLVDRTEDASAHPQDVHDDPLIGAWLANIVGISDGMLTVVDAADASNVSGRVRYIRAVDGVLPQKIIMRHHLCLAGADVLCAFPTRKGRATTYTSVFYRARTLVEHVMRNTPVKVRFYRDSDRLDAEEFDIPAEQSIFFAAPSARVD